MQGTGFSFMIKSAAKAKGVELDEATLFNETSYFHTHPYLANFILGMWVKEYEKGGQPDFFYKKVYSSAFGALGDSFFLAFAQTFMLYRCCYSGVSLTHCRSYSVSGFV